MNTVQLFKKMCKKTAKHAPEILTGIGIAGFTATVVMAVKATPKAMRLIDQELEARQVEKLTPVETIKVAGKCYIPAAITGATSFACLIGADAINVRRNAALATAYTLADTALREYRDKAAEVIGEKKEKQIREEVAKEQLQKHPRENKEVIVSGKGDVLAFDTVSGRYFRTSVDTLRRSENRLNKRLRNEMFISLNEFYYEIGLDPIAIGNDLGWSVDDREFEIDLSAQLSEDDTPCLVVGYRLGPKWIR